MASHEAQVRQQKWTRVGIIVVFVLITAAALSLLPVVDRIGAERQKQGKLSFDEYVRNHHLGKLSLIDTGTGIDPVSDVLTVAQNIPDAQRRSFVMNLMKRYVEYDNGQSLSVMYANPTLKRNVPVGFAEYDDDTHKLQLDITYQNGQVETVTETVHW